MSVEPAAFALGCSHDAGCPPDAPPISMASEICLFVLTFAAPHDTGPDDLLRCPDVYPLPRSPSAESGERRHLVAAVPADHDLAAGDQPRMRHQPVSPAPGGADVERRSLTASGKHHL